MRVIVQRVKEARVLDINQKKVVGQINNGLLILLGIKKGDSKKEVDYLSEKISKLRIMSDKKGKMNLSIKDVKGEVLVVSQFTLYGETKGQNRPSFINAEEPQKAEELYNYFLEKLKSTGIKVEKGSFGNYMEITSVLDGPVTIIINSN
ncbi:D-tyrosyl-tRNA(Tyr) deacylase [Patescibacteria group bacterium]|nr:D-tyrosyl-tRNA(Tyr) deacylase [Patescibacteria group bacterium]MBU2036023.1 D-tyrosyl-tRNA(Tyr) deacylase [Patescibacteria group bacterium]